ncbi:fumarylacetoacetate hydrolase family protein [Methylocella sp.]|uniref:fumarylacetoacetate hydrolase family protein n=1 Tax=Methylocella sp. TaxID=1978226 RepID=UPI003783934B
MTLWCRIEHEGRPRAGVLEGESIRLHEGSCPLAPGAATGEETPAAGARWLTPTAAGKMVALWNNFHAAAQKNGWAIPSEPLYFLKTPQCFAAHAQPIPQPRAHDGRVFYEGELGIVVGRTCRAIAPEEAEAHIFGYTCVDDVTAMELLTRDASFAQWTRAKNFDGFGAFGPVVATGLDPLALRVRTLVNGRERQNYGLDDMIFTPAELVARISADLTLEPGDVIACGTSLGVLPMKPGTTVEVVIEGVGVLRNVYG